MLLFVDIETTGLPQPAWANYQDLEAYKDVHPVSIAWIVSDEETNNVLRREYYLIQPDGYDIPDSEYHNVTHDMAVKYGISYSLLFFKLSALLDSITTVVGYNVKFDTRVLSNAALRRSWHTLAHNLAARNDLCVMLYAKKLLGLRHCVKNGQLYERLIGEPMRNAHDAAADIDATFESYKVLRTLSKPPVQ